MRNLYNKILSRVRGPVALLLMLLCGVLPSAASTETATRLYDSSKLELTRTAEADGSEYLHVSLPGLDQTATPGEPQLPVEYIRFLVPVYTKVTGVSAEARSTFPRSSSVRVYPAQELVTTNHEGPVEFTAPSAAAYSRDYGIRAEYVDDGFIDGCNHIVTVAVYPVGYSPAGGTLTAASEVTVTLEYESCTAAEMTSTPLFPPVRSRYLDLDAMVVNPSKTTDRRYAPRVPALDDAREYYYIITPRNLEKAFGDLAVWKRQKGYNVIVKCIEDIYADPRYRIGVKYSNKESNKSEIILDSAMSLRCYLQDQFLLNGHYFCLLAGDWRTPMPIRRVHDFSSKQQLPNSSDFSPTDDYFSDFTQNVKLTNKYGGIYSLENHSQYNPDITIGRLLCYENNHIRNYTDKLVIYESNPGLGKNDYLKNALIVYEKSALGSIISKDSIPFTNITEIFDKCNTGVATVPHTGSDIIRYMKDNGFISMHSHGTPVSLSTCDSGETGDDVKYVVAINSYRRYYELGPWVADGGDDNARGIDCLQNINSPGVLYSLACEAAPFDDYIQIANNETAHYTMPLNIAQSYTVGGKYGGVAFLSNTRAGSFSKTAGLQTKWYKKILQNPKIGISEAYSKQDYTNDCVYKNYLCFGTRHSLIGEPEFEIWLDKPVDMDVSLDPSANGVVMSGTLPDSTYYALWDGDGNMSRALVSGNQISNPYAGEYCFSLWKSGYLPVITLFGQKGTLSKAKRYVVRNVVLGNPSADNSLSSTYSVVDGGNLSVHAIDKVSTYKGFEIQSGGTVEFDCDQMVELKGGTVKKGGRLVIKAQQISMSDGFRVEEGGILQIENK